MNELIQEVRSKAQDLTSTLDDLSYKLDDSQLVCKNEALKACFEVQLVLDRLRVKLNACAAEST